MKPLFALLFLFASCTAFSAETEMVELRDANDRPFVMEAGELMKQYQKIMLDRLNETFRATGVPGFNGNLTVHTPTVSIDGKEYRIADHSRGGTGNRVVSAGKVPSGGVDFYMAKTICENLGYTRVVRPRLVDAVKNLTPQYNFVWLNKDYSIYEIVDRSENSYTSVGVLENFICEH